MSTLALAAALCAAKVLVVLLRLSDGIAPPLSPWTPLVLVYQDAWVVLAFFGLERLVRGRVGSPVMYGLGLLLVVYAAINIPVARLFSTPLTAAMLAAVGDALADSAGAQLSVANVLAMLTPPILYIGLARRARAFTRPWLIATALVAVVGPLLASQVATLGVHRNALVGLVQSALPSTPGALEAEVELPSHGPALDLRQLRGAARHDNVLLIVLESHGARHLRAFRPDLTVDPTPNLTRLLERAVLFDEVTTPYPESIKGMLAYLCSAVPLPEHDAERHGPERHEAHCLPETLPERASGLFHSGHFAYFGMRHIVAQAGFDTALDARDVGGSAMSSFGTDDRATARRLLAWLDGLDGRPPGERWFAVFMPIAGHHPYHAPGDATRPFPQASDEDAYHNDLAVGDAATGVLLDGLAARGLMDQTLIVVIGDHGQAFQEHPGNFAHSLFVYQENLHVPFALVLPDMKSALHAPQRGSLADLAPTVHALLGLAPDPLFEGRSLLEPESPWVVSFTDHRSLQLAVRVSDERGDWKLILEGARPELYDLGRDPGETRDLSQDEPAVTAHLSRFLTAWHALHYRRFLERDFK